MTLRNKEYDLLLELASHPGRLLTRTALLRHIWDYAYPANSRTVDVHVTLLRDKLAGSTVEIQACAASAISSWSGTSGVSVSGLSEVRQSGAIALSAGAAPC